MEYKLELAPCYYCSTTEGEPELYPNNGDMPYCNPTYHSAPLHWCHDKRPCSGTTSKWYGPVLS